MAFSLPYNTSNFTGFGEYVNNITGGIFWVVMLFVFVFVLYTTLSGFKARNALAAALFIGSIIGGIMVTLDFITDTAWTWIIISLAIVAAFLAWDKS